MPFRGEGGPAQGLRAAEEETRGEGMQGGVEGREGVGGEGTWTAGANTRATVRERPRLGAAGRDGGANYAAPSCLQRAWLQSRAGTTGRIEPRASESQIAPTGHYVVKLSVARLHGGQAMPRKRPAM